MKSNYEFFFQGLHLLKIQIFFIKKQFGLIYWILYQLFTFCSDLIGDQRLLLFEFHFMLISNADACDLLDNVDSVVGAYVVKKELALVTKVNCVIVFRGWC